MKLEACRMFEKKMKPLAEKEGLVLKKCSDYHYQLQGVFLVNIYPSKRTFYVQGTNRKVSYYDLNQLIQVSLGDENLQVDRNKTKRKSLGEKKPTLWARSRLCFVCGIEIATIEEATIEHKVPLYRGGSNRLDNLALSHANCNHERGNNLSVKRTKDEYHETSYHKASYTSKERRPVSDNDVGKIQYQSL